MSGIGDPAVATIEPMRMAMFHPVQNARPKRSQQRNVIREQRETEWKHPETDQREEAEDPSKREQHTRWNPQPAAGRLPDPMNS